MRLLARAPRPAPAAPRLPTGCPSLDDLLGGGVEAGTLTEVHGEAGAGKTNLCLQLARNAARAGGRVVYLDTEGVSRERLAQLCGPDLAMVEQRLLFERPATPPEQARAAERAARIARAVEDVRLLVVDSGTLLYRVQLAEGEGIAERRALLRQLQALQAAARHRGIALVVTNQVFAVPGQPQPQALGGHALRHLAGCVLRLERGAGPGERRALLLKHRARPEGLAAPFRIGPTGLESLAVAPPAEAGASTHSPKSLSTHHPARARG